LIKNLREDTDVLTVRLAQKYPITSDIQWTAAQAAMESSRIVGTGGFYPERRLGGDYIERFTPIMEQRLTIAGERLAGLLTVS
jgi:hypothetical protein